MALAEPSAEYAAGLPQPPPPEGESGAQIPDAGIPDHGSERKCHRPPPSPAAGPAHSPPPGRPSAVSGCSGHSAPLSAGSEGSRDLSLQNTGPALPGWIFVRPGNIYSSAACSCADNLVVSLLAGKEDGVVIVGQIIFAAAAEKVAGRNRRAWGCRAGSAGHSPQTGYFA